MWPNQFSLPVLDDWAIYEGPKLVSRTSDTLGKALSIVENINISDESSPEQSNMLRLSACQLSQSLPWKINLVPCFPVPNLVPCFPVPTYIPLTLLLTWSLRRLSASAQFLLALSRVVHTLVQTTTQKTAGPVKRV